MYNLDRIEGVSMKEYFKRLYTKNASEYYIKLSKYLDNNEKKFIITANPETFKLAQEDREIEGYLLDAENDVIPDGIAVVKGAHRFGVDVKERITGMDTAVKLLELLNNKKKSIYLFGARPEVLDKVVEMIKRDYPRITIAGYTDGYVEDKDAVFEEILSLSPDAVLVAIGIPLQEKLIGKYICRAKKGIFMGVGGVFDVLSGTKKRAPKVFIKLNLEWLYRIVTEPKRLKRFYQNNVKFMFDVYREKK